MRLLGTAAAFAAGLALAEVGARLLRADEPAPPRAEGEVVARSADPELGLENRPGAEQVLVYPATARAPERRVRARVNAQGWRGPPVAPAPAPGVVRIAALGDSHTFGHGVEDGEAWPAVLERELRRAGLRAEVVNCGVNGLDGAQAFATLERRVLALAPDLVLYGFFCNDAAVRGVPAPPPGTPEPPAAGGAVLERLRAHSRFADVVAGHLERRARNRAWAEHQARLYDEERAGWRALRDGILRGRTVLAARDARLAVVLVPLFVESEGELVSSAAHRRMSAFCAREGIECLDLEPHYAGLDPGALRVHPGDLHAGAEAHRIAGTALARWLAERDLVRN